MRLAAVTTLSWIAGLEPISTLTFVVTAPPNKSLDVSGGGVFRILTGPAMLD
jgi:hypothetical protein